MKPSLPGNGAIAATLLFVGVTLLAWHISQPSGWLFPIRTPTFHRLAATPSAADGLIQLESELHGRSAIPYLSRMLPGEGAAIWIGLLLVLLVAIDYERPFSLRNLDLLVVQAIAICLYDSLALFDQIEQPEYRWLLRTQFAVVTAITAFLMLRAMWRAMRPPTTRWSSNVRTPALAAAALLLLTIDLGAVYLRQPDDSSFFANLGAQRYRERDRLPYGDPLLTHTAGSAYAPLMYGLHAIVQIAVGEPMNRVSPDVPAVGADAYRLPPPLATEIVLGLFQVVAAGSLVAIGWRRRDLELGCALAVLYCGSAYVLGVGGTEEFVGGLTFVSHIVPTSITLLAFACLGLPGVAGALMAAAAATGFYPAFMAPAWLGYYAGRRRARPFAIGFALVSVAVVVWVLVDSQPADGLSLLGTIMRDTLGHHTDPSGYGMSPFGFWGQREGGFGALIKPLVGASALTSPFFLAYLTLMLGSFAIARGRDEIALAELTAAIAMGANLWKIHATGTYVTWYYPFLLFALLARGRVTPEVEQART